jgi:hypothetical protein
LKCGEKGHVNCSSKIDAMVALSLDPLKIISQSAKSQRAFAKSLQEAIATNELPHFILEDPEVDIASKLGIRLSAEDDGSLLFRPEGHTTVLREYCFSCGDE